MKINDLSTPALLIESEITNKNLRSMQNRADLAGVSLRPHIKTHRTSHFARLQIDVGARGITCAKVGEAEVMASAGIDDIFIANEIVGTDKYKRIKSLSENITIRSAVDDITQLRQIEEVFYDKIYEVLIEIEVGEVRSGIEDMNKLVSFANQLKNFPHVKLVGVFSHEGHTYGATSAEHAIALAHQAYDKTITAANILREMGFEIKTVSVGATPSLLNTMPPDGITEIRPGTYIFMDCGQAGAIGSYDRCSASVLTTVISKPTNSRVVLDAGAKALIPQNRIGGICDSGGFGKVLNDTKVNVIRLFDEHAIIEDENFSQKVKVGDKVRIIPSHICPTVNLYDNLFIINGENIEKIDIDARGKSQ